MTLFFDKYNLLHNPINTERIVKLNISLQNQFNQFQTATHIMLDCAGVESTTFETDKASQTVDSW